jgi:hypothetical protein
MTGKIDQIIQKYDDELEDLEQEMMKEEKEGEKYFEDKDLNAYSSIK